MAEFKRTQRDYPLSFKIAVVEQVEKGEMTYKQAQLHYGIQGRSTVLTWSRKHGHLNWALGLPHLSGRELPMSQPPAPLTPEQRIRKLEEQLELVTQKAEFLDAVVNMLKNDYEISVIIKRPGKSSRKNRAKKSSTIWVLLSLLPICPEQPKRKKNCAATR
ncbi:Uncharacterised protein [Serratia fonticola]|nr:Uncharacterised protein [Serratia fonticola]